jgi:4-hydroxy-tetrahydrodipicolinate synthase
MKEVKLWTALITPMNSDGSVNFEDLEKVVRRQSDAGNGILLIGSTGEGLALLPEEKRDIVELVIRMELNVPVMAGVGGHQLAKQKEWIQTCNDLGIDAFLLVTPLYAKPGDFGQIDWFNSLMDASEKPCMVYNIPSRTGVKLTVKVLNEIKKHDRFWSVKEASSSLADYQQFRDLCPDVSLFSGDDGLLPFLAVNGCEGLVSVSSNVWPHETGLYVEKCLNSDTKDLFPVWKHAIESLFSAPNPVPVKLLLKEKGVIRNSFLRPPLSEKEVVSISRFIEADNQILNWYKTQMKI